MLGKPYVLWPICVGMLLAAFFVAKQLQGDRVEKPLEIVEVEPKQNSIAEPDLIDVELRVRPNPSDATLTIDGNERSLAELKLEPGQYDVKIRKDGFEPFVSSLDIDAGNNQFDITLIESVTDTSVVVKPVKPPEPTFVDVRIVVEPADATLWLSGEPVNSADGVVRLSPEEFERLSLEARAEGYEPFSETWSWEELAAADYELKLSLDKMSAPIETPSIALPDKSARFFEVQQFQKKLYRPAVIDGILKTGSLKAALASLDTNYETEETDFRDKEIIAEYHPPSVQITYPTDGWSTEQQTVNVKGEAYSVNGQPLTALTLLHNGSVAKVFRPTKVDQIAMLIEHEVRLKPGQNDLVLIAANAKSSSQGKHIVVDLSGATEQRLPSAWVVSIGVSEFEGGLTGLPNAAADAAAFASAMQSHKNGRLYGNVQTKQLTGSVSDREILDAFQWLSDNTHDGDVAMVYIASHGLVDRRDNFYIAGSNSTEAKARSTAVSWRDLMDMLQLDLPDCQRLVFLDLEPTENAIRPGLRSPLLDLASPEMGTVFLSSNTLQQKPVQLAEAANGTFIKAVLETVGDRTFDTTPDSGDKLFNPVELASGVTKRIKGLTKDKQQPVFFTPEHARLANVLELQD